MPSSRRSVSLAPLVTAIALGASGVHAQTEAAGGGLVARPIAVGDRMFNTVGEERIGRTDCLDDAVILFEIDNVPLDFEFIDLWEGQRCNDTSRTNQDTSDCVWLGSEEITSGQRQPLEISVQTLADGDCEDDGVTTLWFLVVNDDNSSEEPRAFDDVKITLDFRPPAAPPNVKGGSGERQIPVSWDLPSGDDLERFVIYIDNDPHGDGDDDAGAGGPAECASSLIMEGMSAEDVPDEVEVVRVGSGSTTSRDLGPGNITGDVAAVAVTAVDEAGNESALSNIACVRVVPTEGFWERYQAAGGSPQTGCPCSAPGPAHAQQAWPVALSLLLLARRRRQR